MAADDVPDALAGDEEIKWKRDAQATRFGNELREVDFTPVPGQPEPADPNDDRRVQQAAFSSWPLDERDYLTPADRVFLLRHAVRAVFAVM